MASGEVGEEGSKRNPTCGVHIDELGARALSNTLDEAVEVGIRGHDILPVDDRGGHTVRSGLLHHLGIGHPPMPYAVSSTT